VSVFYFSILLGLPIAGSILCLFSLRQRLFEVVTLVSTGLTFLTTLFVSSLVLDGVSIGTPNEWFLLDALSVFVMLLVSGSAFVVAVYSIGYLRRQVRNKKVDGKMLRLYYGLLNVFLFTMMLVLASNNLGFLWIGAESSTLATAFLVAYYERERSIEAAWKYVIICSVGITLALFGIILTYFSALHVIPSADNALNWSTLISVGKRLDPEILKLAFIFILVGFGTKAGLAPFHMWKPDAYSEAPAPISALMAAGLVNVALYALLRFYILVNKAVGGDFASNLFIIAGILSMCVAVPFILLQRNYKRMLAYSSVEHVGIIVFAIGLGTPLSYLGALLHMLNNTLAKLVLFLTAGNIRSAYQTKITRRVTGAIKVIPVSATLFILGIFAVTGWPPFGLFVSEFSIITAGFASGKIFPSVVFIGLVATVFIGFIYYGTGMVLGKASRNSEEGEGSIVSLIMIAVLLIFLLMLGTVIPSFISDFITKAVAVIKS
jgi:hydrogenase-4 component F